MLEDGRHRTQQLWEIFVCAAVGIFAEPYLDGAWQKRASLNYDDGQHPGRELAREGALHHLSRVRCPQPWPRPTTARSRRRSSGDDIHSAAPSHPAPATPGFRLLHKLHAAACAVLCGGHQERACPQPLWRRANPGGTAAQHAPGALLRSGRVLPRAHLYPLPTCHPPAQRTLCRTHPQRHGPHGCRCPRHIAAALQQPPVTFAAS